MNDYTKSLYNVYQCDSLYGDILINIVVKQQQIPLG